MNNDWENKLLKVADRSTLEQEKEFLSLVDQSFGNCTLYVAKVLMKTFSDKPDYGTQERVNSALATADKDIRIQVLLEELPRLIKEAPEWANSLIAQEINFRLSLLEKIALTMPQENQVILKNILNNEDVIDSNPEAIQFKNKLARN